MYNQHPGSLRGDDRIDLVGPNRMLERARNRAQDHFTGDEEATCGMDAAAATVAERKAAARRAREGMHATLTGRIRGWWSARSRRS